MAGLRSMQTMTQKDIVLAGAPADTIQTLAWSPVDHVLAAGAWDGTVRTTLSCVRVSISSEAHMHEFTVIESLSMD